MKNTIHEFETALAEFTGAKGVIVTDSCTHAVELGLRYSTPKMYATIPAQCHFTVPMTLRNLGIEYMFTESKWKNEFRIEGSIVYNSGEYLAKDMFQTENPNQRKIVCVSFADGAPLDIGGGGAILTNSKEAYDWLKRAANDGRDADIKFWQDQKDFSSGFHYSMRESDAAIGLEKLANNDIAECDFGYGNYPDLRDILINKQVAQRLQAMLVL